MERGTSPQSGRDTHRVCERGGWGPGRGKLGRVRLGGTVFRKNVKFKVEPQTNSLLGLLVDGLCQPTILVQ